VSLRALARWAIVERLRTGREPPVDPGAFPPALREQRASFVTLRRGGELRGCTGSLASRQPLVCDLVQNACRSAFGDPRFPPLESRELDGLDVHVSLLSPLEPLHVDSEAQLLAALRPGVDGLVLRDGAVSATFLPDVWRSLQQPRAFLEALRTKAGLPAGHWSDTLRCERYTVEDAD
jgi:AmmeMemoRadiSam system protein A